MLSIMTESIPSFRLYKKPAISNFLRFINILFEFGAD